jgi:hypothetical protein
MLFSFLQYSYHFDIPCIEKMVSHCHKALFVPLFFIVYYTFIPTVYVADIQLFRSAYQPPASSTFLSEQTIHQQSVSSTFL